MRQFLFSKAVFKYKDTVKRFKAHSIQFQLSFNYTFNCCHFSSRTVQFNLRWAHFTIPLLGSSRVVFSSSLFRGLLHIQLLLLQQHNSGNMQKFSFIFQYVFVYDIAQYLLSGLEMVIFSQVVFFSRIFTFSFVFQPIFLLSWVYLLVVTLVQFLRLHSAKSSIRLPRMSNCYRIQIQGRRLNSGPVPPILVSKTVFRLLYEVTWYRFVVEFCWSFVSPSY